MVAPNGTTRASSIAKAPNGAIIEGSSGDVSVLQANKFADFRVGFLLNYFFIYFKIYRINSLDIVLN